MERIEMIRNFESGLDLVYHVKSQCYGDNTRLLDKLRNFSDEQVNKIIHTLSSTLTPTQLFKIVEEYNKFCKAYSQTTKVSDIDLSEKESKWFSCCVEFDIQENTNKILKKIKSIIEKKVDAIFLKISPSLTPTQLLEAAKEYKKICKIYNETFEIIKNLISKNDGERFFRCIKIDIQQFDSKLLKKIKKAFDKDLKDLSSLAVLKYDEKSTPKMWELTTTSLLFRNKLTLIEALIMFNVDFRKNEIIKDKIETNIGTLLSRCLLQ